MVLWAAGRWVNAWRSVRLGALATAALLFTHEAVYHLRFGFGPRLSGAMSAGGHDAYWRLFTAGGLTAAAALTLAGAARLARLAWRLRRLEAQPSWKVGRSEGTTQSYRTELVGLWRWLFPIVAVAFVAQENVESLAVGAGVPGLGILGGSGLVLALALAVVGAVTLAVSAAGAIIRWRIRLFEARLADAAAAVRHERSRSVGLPRGWWIAAALCAQRWTIDRQDAGRAPPTAFLA